MIIHDTSREARIRLREQYSGQTARIITTNGCFDLFHAGHAHFLQQCATWKGAFGTLIVLVNTDDSIIRLKGPHRPINDWLDRATCVDAVKGVDFVLPLCELDPCIALRDLQPRIHVKDDAYRKLAMPETPVVQEGGGEVVFLPHWGHLSTTSLIQRIQSLQ